MTTRTAWLPPLWLWWPRRPVCEAILCRRRPSAQSSVLGSLKMGRKVRLRPSQAASRRPRAGVEKPPQLFPGRSAPRPPVPTTSACRIPASFRSPAPRLTSLSALVGGPGVSLEGRCRPLPRSEAGQAWGSEKGRTGGWAAHGPQATEVSYSPSRSRPRPIQREVGGSRKPVGGPGHHCRSSPSAGPRRPRRAGPACQYLVEKK